MTETIHIDKDRALELLRQAVSGREDYVYSNPGYDSNDRPSSTNIKCAYAHGDQPGCLVGHVLRLVGVPMDVIRRLDGIGDAAEIFEVSNSLAEHATAEQDAVEALCRAQSAQDGGATWGDSLRAAETEDSEDGEPDVHAG